MFSGQDLRSALRDATGLAHSLRFTSVVTGCSSSRLERRPKHVCQYLDAGPGIRGDRSSFPLAGPSRPHGPPILTRRTTTHVSIHAIRNVWVGNMTDPKREGVRHARRKSQTPFQPQLRPATVVRSAPVAPVFKAIRLVRSLFFEHSPRFAVPRLGLGAD